MIYKKRYAESVVLNGEMVVMGGYNNNQGWLSAVEKRGSDGEWSEMEGWALPRLIFDFCAVPMDDNRIMVLGKTFIGRVILVCNFRLGSRFFVKETSRTLELQDAQMEAQWNFFMLSQNKYGYLSSYL